MDTNQQFVSYCFIVILLAPTHQNRLGSNIARKKGQLAPGSSLKQVTLFRPESLVLSLARVATVLPSRKTRQGDQVVLRRLLHLCGWQRRETRPAQIGQRTAIGDLVA